MQIDSYISCEKNYGLPSFDNAKATAAKWGVCMAAQSTNAKRMTAKRLKGDLHAQKGVIPSKAVCCI